jgi:hypothetical protein
MEWLFKALGKLSHKEMTYLSFVGVLVIFVMIFHFISWLPGLVTTSEFNPLSDKVNFILEDSVETQIRDKLRTKCETSDQKLQIQISDDVNNLEKRYYSITGQGLKQPSCAELL